MEGRVFDCDSPSCFSKAEEMVSEKQCDVLIVGGGVGGCAAAIAVCRMGFRAVMTEETEWIGGQLTSQGVPPDEHGWIEKFGCTSNYRKFREGVRQYYRENTPLTPEAAKDVRLNPGNGWVSPICHEPKVALAVLREMLASYEKSGLLTILLRHSVIEDKLRSFGVISSVVLRNAPSGEDLQVKASYFLDASELGDLLPLCGAKYVTGAESQEQTGEASAPEKASPDNVQSISMCFAMDHLEGENHVIEVPEMYDYWREYMPKLNPAWPGKLLSWEAPNPRTMEISQYHFDPHNEVPSLFSGLWSFRRILDREMFEPGFLSSDVCIVNWPMIDYMEADILNCSEEERLRSIERARQLSLSVFYWMQTDAPRPDGGKGWPGLRLRKDIMETDDGLAKYPYIRESRRIKAEFTICEHHVAAASRPRERLAAEFADSVGIGYYRIDLHPSTGGDNYIDVESLPFQIPLGALIPVDMENMLPAAKNIGTTHITNGCYRLHPVEWNIGEVSGSLAAYCLQKEQTPRAVYRDKGELRHFQDELEKNGIELRWPSDLVLDEGDPHAHARPRA